MPYKIRHLWTQFATLEKFPKLFTPEECEKIVATYVRDAPIRTEINIKGEQYRDTDVSWISGGDSGAAWIFERLERSVMKWNANNFNFDIEECSDLQLTCYKPGQFYDWHADLGLRGTSRRKISSVVMMSAPSEYEGGKLEFFVGEGGVRTVDLARGDLVVFASWLKHRVTDVAKGVRWSLVGWWSGPPLR